MNIIKRAIRGVPLLVLALLSACGGSSGGGGGDGGGNNAPTDIALSNDNLDEFIDASAGTIVGALSGTDEDVPADTLSFTVVGGADQSVFSAVGGNLVITDGVLDDEGQSSYEVIVEVDDGNDTYQETFTVLVNDLGDFNFYINNACGIETINGAAVTLPAAASAAVPPGGAAITTEPAFPALTFDRPIAMKQVEGDASCWFVAEQPGRVFAFENVSDVSERSAFIDISDRVDDGPNEAGLLGMAFHPNFTNNLQVFLSYTGNNGDLTSYVSRFTSSDGGATLDPDSEEVLLSLLQPFGNHNGGNIAFGPDGYLYIGFGDGGSGNDPGERAQNTTNLYGAILRIDVDAEVPYAIPGDNPFAGNELCSQGFGAADCPELYAWGLRNPWRWSFDSGTGDLWLGDVGQTALEEIDIIDLGGNYGWPFYEGTLCNQNAPMVDCDFVGLLPVTEYPRTVGRAVTGGYVYHGTDIPDLIGVYVYADYVTGSVFQYFDSGGGNIIESTTDTALTISSFGQATDGELYLFDLLNGKIHKLVAD